MTKLITCLLAGHSAACMLAQCASGHRMLPCKLHAPPKQYSVSPLSTDSAVVQRGVIETGWT